MLTLFCTALVDLTLVYLFGAPQVIICCTYLSKCAVTASTGTCPFCLMFLAVVFVWVLLTKVQEVFDNSVLA